MTARRRVRFLLELAVAYFWLARIELGLRRRDLPTICRMLGIAADMRSAAPAATERAVLPRNLRTAVLARSYAVARWPAGTTCLRRCLLLGHRLRKLDPVLRIGVRRDDDNGGGGAFIAHSWLEVAGRTLDPEAARYETLGAA
jgi:hypothetical protein